MKRLIWLLVLATGCSNDPVDAEGMYTVSVTNRTNGCNFANWMENDSAAAIPVTVNQEGADATADVMGATRIYLDLVLGSHVFNGTVDGDELDLKIEGTPSTTTGNCTWSVDAQLLARLQGDVLTGKINYTVAHNGHTDCAPYEGCVSFQDMNGTRPPQ